MISYDAEADVYVKREKCIEWIKGGQVQYRDSCQVNGFFWELYPVDGKIYYRVWSGGGAHKARRLAQIAGKYVDFRTYWRGDGDYIDLANSDDFWEVIDNPLGSAACAEDINGTEYVIVHKGDGDLNPLDTFAVQVNW